MTALFAVQPPEHVSIIERILEGSQPITAEYVFASPQNLDEVIEHVRTETLAVRIDCSTAQGRKDCAALAHKVARSKTALDAIGKAWGEEAHKRWKMIASERTRMAKALDALRDEIRRPLDEIERAEKDRVDAHETALGVLRALASLPPDPSRADIADRINMASNLILRDWEEYFQRAKEAHALVSNTLTAHLTAAEAREIERAELAKLQRQAAEQAEKQRIETIAQQAAEKARAEVEVRLKKEAEEQTRRENNKRWVAKINREIVKTLVARCSIEEAMAYRVMQAIADGDIPHTRITY